MRPSPLNRPWWLSPDDWRQLLALHGGAPRCAVIGCGRTDGLSVDHIQARFYRGTHDIGNLQFMCGPHNSQKGIKNDAYWSKTFYWDGVPDLDRLRTAQRRAYETLLLDPEVAEYFAQFPTQVAGKLYLNDWVVAAGKSLAIPVIAFAYNQLQRMNWAATRRADRILVLTKEQAIRDQLAESLRNDINGFGIRPDAPRVCVLEKYDWLRDEGFMRGQDAVVACVQMLWDAKNQPKADIIEILGKFPLIFIDEPHFAPDQVRKILDLTPRSVVFGLTGSPMKGNAKYLHDYVLLTGYTYQDSDTYDAGVKYLSDDDTNLTKVALNEAEVLVAGMQHTIKDFSDPDYDVSQLVPAMNVVSAVIRKMEECDAAQPGRSAPHRDENDWTDLLYPAHAIVRCESRKLADTLCKQTQAFFEGNRRKYPASAGFNAERIFVGDDEIPGDRLDSKTHPWMRSWNRGVDPTKMSFRSDSRCARILFVVGMAREGVSNPLCCITASVDGTKSIVVVVQGLAGRALRTVQYVDDDGVRHLPPEILDTVHIFVHEAHEETQSVIQRGVRFILNMENHFGELASLNDVINGNAPIVEFDEDKPLDDPLTLADRIAIATHAWITQPRWRSDEEATQRIVRDVIDKFAPDNPDKAQRITDWVAGPLRQDPDRAWRMTGHIGEEDLPSIAVVLDERERHEASAAQLCEFISWNAPELAPLTENPTEESLVIFRVMYERWANERVLPQAHADEEIETIRRAYTKEVKNFLRPYVGKGDPRGMEFQVAAHRYVGKAVLRILNVPRGESAGKGTKWDCPQVHVVLHRPDIKRAIQGYARSRLVGDGWCPDIAKAFGLMPHDDE